ncbi:MAG: hypothetical protein Q9166_002210 [cf. Caloplaca sp. 2 TL-2023]
MTSDPLEEALGLENTFYQEGYDLGVQDGSRVGRIEGRLFGLQQAFEKFSAMGRLHGRSVIWYERLSPPPQVSDLDNVNGDLKTSAMDVSNRKAEDAGNSSSGTSTSLPQILHNPRLEKHIRTLYALTEPASLSTENTDPAVDDLMDRLKRAEGKVKVIEKLVGEESFGEYPQPTDGSFETDFTDSLRRPPSTADHGIEDVDVLQARH